MVLLGIAFLAGVITALSPCVLPVLPILLAGGASGRRPYGIILGLVGSFSVFTVVGASLLNSLGLPQDTLRNLAIMLLFVLAATLLFPPLARLVERPLLFLGRRQPRTESNGVILGMSLGLVFVPCAGPVLGAVTALSATGGGGVETFIVALAYSAGHALPMLAIAVGSRRLTQAIGVLRRHAEGTRQIAGALLAVSAVAITLGVDQRLATAIPGYTQAFQNRIERSPTARRELSKLRRTDSQPPLAAEGEAAAREAPVAPEFEGIVEWVNSKPLSLKALRGRVVLVDFWTYSCINCLRTFPYLKAWDRAYRDDGLTIVGVHSPEFAFERVPDNVRAAVRKQGLRYPVALDNDFATWTAYANEYWPAKYLIDRGGKVRYFHFGEGEYEETEKLIRRYLGEKVDGEVRVIADRRSDAVLTPESYLGFARIDRFAGPVVPNRETRYLFPTKELGADELAYSGRIKVESERLVAGRDARLKLQFRARKVHLVLGGTGHVKVLLNGRKARTIRVSGEPRLYTLLSLGDLQEGLLELRFAPGLAAYAFTFG